MLQVSQLTKNYGPRTLFEGVSLQMNAGSRYGIVGANGAGKTTFLRILTDDEAPSDGTVTYPKTARVGVLRQDRFTNDDEQVLSVAMRGDEAVFEVLREQEQLLEAGGGDGLRLAALEERLSTLDGYTLEARAAATLVGLGIPEDKLRGPLGALSGGFKLRVLLAQVLVGRPEILLLDEPTNHLDILSIKWLEGFLKEYQGCAVIISHDHLFLNAVTSHILDVDYGTITAYVGNYDAFLIQKEQTQAQREAENARLEKIVAQKKAFVERFKAKATKARQAQSRAKQIDKIEIEDLPQTSRRHPRFVFEQLRPSGREVLTLDSVSKAYGELKVLSDVSLQVRRGERVAVVGANGLGKSTLLKIAEGTLDADAGVAEWGHETRVGYFAQDHVEILNNPKATPLDVVWDVVPMETTSHVRGILGRMLFSSDDVHKPVSSLSGGEAARVIFGRLMAEKPNVLLLDEPTNHLDLEAIEALTKALIAFEGTLLFVSHDRWLVSQLATRVVEVTKEGIVDYAGTYAEYLARSGEDHLSKAAVVQKAQTQKRNNRTDSAGLSWDERKRLQNKKKALPRRRDAVFEEIVALEQKVASYDAKYCEPGFYEDNPPSEIQRLEREQAAIRETVQEKTAEWESIEEELAELEEMEL